MVEQNDELRDTKRGGEESAGKDKEENAMKIKYKKGSINLEGSRKKKKQKAGWNKDYCWSAKIWKRQQRGDAWKEGKEKRNYER
jgi:hypothetical protein